eukprot:gene12850-12977_t
MTDVELLVFVLGAPGAGKGTQCELIKKKYGWAHISAGDLLRAEVAAGSDKGAEIQEYMRQGAMVPSSWIIGLLQAAIVKGGYKKVLVDGFPRELSQLQDFEKQAMPCTKTLFYNVSEEVAYARLKDRSATSGRVDDNDDTIHKRFLVFVDDSMPVVDSLRSVGKTDLSDIRTPVVICGPSGVGKGTLISKLMQRYSNRFGFSVSHTTRGPRPGEEHGVHYFFTDQASMQPQVEGGMFLEHALVHGNMYGTSLAAVARVSAEGKHCVLDIDVQGAQQVRRSAVGDLSLFIFIAPPSHEELERRLRNRGTESEEKVLQRLSNAEAEIAKAQGMPVRQYMDATVIPVLREGLKALNATRPDDPLQYLADYLVAHKSLAH